MKESTKIVKERYAKIRREISSAYKRAMKKNSLQSWEDSYKYLQRKISDLSEIAETRTARDEVIILDGILVGFDIDARKYLQEG